jgi:hypothetical protein
MTYYDYDEPDEYDDEDLLDEDEDDDFTKWKRKPLPEIQQMPDEIVIMSQNGVPLEEGMMVMVEGKCQATIDHFGFNGTMDNFRNSKKIRKISRIRIREGIPVVDLLGYNWYPTDIFVPDTDRKVKGRKVKPVLFDPEHLVTK